MTKINVIFTGLSKFGAFSGHNRGNSYLFYDQHLFSISSGWHLDILRGKGIAMVITSMDSECPYDKALNILKELQSNTLHVFGAASFATDALDIACRTKRTFYESLYVALAIKAACRMVRAKLEGAKIDGAESKGR